MNNSDIVDREFTDTTDMMIVAQELQGKDLKSLAEILCRSYDSVINRREQLILSGKYHRLKAEILTHQRDAKMKFASTRRFDDPVKRLNRNKEVIL